MKYLFATANAYLFWNGKRQVCIARFTSVDLTFEDHKIFIIGILLQF